MRKLVWMGLLVLPLVIAGSMVHGQSGPGGDAANVSSTPACPLQSLHRQLHNWHSKLVPASNEDCPLRCLLKQFHS
jgi:hypothetical protein